MLFTSEKREGTVDTKGVRKIPYQRISLVSYQVYPLVYTTRVLIEFNKYKVLEIPA